MDLSFISIIINSNVSGLAEDRYRILARESVISYQRLLFTLWHNVKDFKDYGLKEYVLLTIDDEL